MRSVLTLKRKTGWTCAGTCPIPGESTRLSCINCLGRKRAPPIRMIRAKRLSIPAPPLVEVLKAGGLLLDADMAAIRETVTMTVLVEANDGYRAVFSLAELDPELIDRIVLLADTKDGQPLPPREGVLPHHRSRRETPGALGAPSQGSD